MYYDYITRCHEHVICQFFVFANDFCLNVKVVVNEEHLEETMFKNENAVNHEIMNKLETVKGVSNLFLWMSLLNH